MAQEQAPRSLAGRPDESEEQTLDRNMNELLQELRVAQTGVQILFAFLLTIAFQPRFDDITTFQLGTYVVTLMLSAGASGFLVAPVAHHRLLFRQRRRRELVQSANRCSIVGLTLLMMAMTGSVLLVLDVVLDGALTWVLTGVVALVLVTVWFAIPLRQRLA